MIFSIIMLYSDTFNQTVCLCLLSTSLAIKKNTIYYSIENYTWRLEMRGEEHSCAGQGWVSTVYRKFFVIQYTIPKNTDIRKIHIDTIPKLSVYRIFDIAQYAYRYHIDISVYCTIPIFHGILKFHDTPKLSKFHDMPKFYDIPKLYYVEISRYTKISRYITKYMCWSALEP